MSVPIPALLAVAALADVEPEDVAVRWLNWLSVELARRGTTPTSRLLVLWDVLEEQLADGEFQSARITGSAKARGLLRRLLEQLARDAGAFDPHGLAYQLQMLVEGTVVGALIDGQPQVPRAARHLARFALEASAAPQLQLQQGIGDADQGVL
jgi:hypothetical protein